MQSSLRGATTIKGLESPVPVWAFGLLRKDTEDHWLTEFVGRTSELRQFKSIVDDVVSEGTGQALLLRGEPGIGKTRLASEFVRLAGASGLRVHRVAIVDFGTNRGPRTLRDLVATLLSLGAGASREQRHDAKVRALREGVATIESEVFLNDLLDLEQPDQLRSAYEALDSQTRNDGIRATLSTMVAQLSHAEPRLIVIEDIHWADAQTLDALTGMALGLPDCPAILVLTSRIEGRTLDQEWLSSL